MAKFPNTKQKISSLWENSQKKEIQTNRIVTAFEPLIIDSKIKNAKIYETNWTPIEIASEGINGNAPSGFPIGVFLDLFVDVNIKEEYLPFLNVAIISDSTLPTDQNFSYLLNVDSVEDESTQYLYVDDILVYRGLHYRWWNSSGPNLYKAYIPENELNLKNFLNEFTYAKYKQWDAVEKVWWCFWDAGFIYPMGRVRYRETFYWAPPSTIYSKLNSDYLLTRFELLSTPIISTSDIYPPHLAISFIKIGEGKFRICLKGTVEQKVKVSSTPDPYIDEDEELQWNYGTYHGSPHWHLTSEVYPQKTLPMKNYFTEAVSGDSFRVKMLIGIEPPTDVQEVKGYGIPRK